MKKLQKEINENLARAMTIYNPVTAFGNTKLLFYVKKLEELSERQEKAMGCNVCDEDGFIETECSNCNGTGKENIICEHEK